MEDKKPRKRFKFKLYFGCFLFVVLVLTVMGVAVGILTYTGYTKQWACSVVVEDSSAWDSLGCQTDPVAADLGANYKELQKLLENGTPEEKIVGIVELSKPSVVGIGIEGDTFSSGGILGTGFVIEDGMIATNQHVVSETNASYFVQISGVDEVLNVKAIYRDQVNDIAILEVENNANLVPLALGDSDNLKTGQQVIAIGNPLGELSGSVTTGVISGLGRNVDINSGSFFNTSVESFDDVIQTDAAINPGNSGGPLLNLKGEVIGINFATINGADNLSFALPINRIKSRIDELKEFGEFRMPYLGVEYKNRLVFVDNQTLAAAQVVTVAKDSPAETAGVAIGDFIIGFNGEDLGEQNLSHHIQGSEIGETIKLNIIRGKEKIEVSAEIGVK